MAFKCILNHKNPINIDKGRGIETIWLKRRHQLNPFIIEKRSPEKNTFEKSHLKDSLYTPRKKYTTHDTQPYSTI